MDWCQCKYRILLCTLQTDGIGISVEFHSSFITHLRCVRVPSNSFEFYFTSPGITTDASSFQQFFILIPKRAYMRDNCIVLGIGVWLIPHTPIMCV